MCLQIKGIPLLADLGRRIKDDRICVASVLDEIKNDNGPQLSSTTTTEQQKYLTGENKERKKEVGKAGNSTYLIH